MAKLKVLTGLEINEDTRAKYNGDYLTVGAVYLEGDEVTVRLQEAIALLSLGGFEAVDAEAKTAVEWIERKAKEGEG